MIDISKRNRILEKFRCQRTGNCCRVDGVVIANQLDIQNIARHLKMDVSQFLNTYTVVRNGYRVIADRRFRPGCFVKSNGECAVYSVRPSACRGYPNWDVIWESKEHLMAEFMVCKGLKQAYEEVSQDDPLFNI